MLWLFLVSAEETSEKDNTFVDPALKTLGRYLIYHLE